MKPCNILGGGYGNTEKGTNMVRDRTGEDWIDLSKECPRHIRRFHIYPKNDKSYCGLPKYITHSELVVSHNGWSDRVHKETLDDMGELVCKKCLKAHNNQRDDERD